MSSTDQPSVNLLPSAAAAAVLWPSEVPEDVRAFLDQNSSLRGDKAEALNLAYDEYCQQVEAGSTPDPDAFCARFPTFQSSLRRAIQVHEYLAANPGLLEEREAIAWPVEGETFLGFRLLRELGRGSFARVFLAAEPDLGDRLVAVKVSPHGGTEAATLARLNHPNVVQVYEVRQDERSGLTAVCMPYLGAATLEGILAAKAAGRAGSARVILDVGRAGQGAAGAAGDGPAPHPLLATASYAEGVCLLGAQLADALAFLHRRSIFHRDLKPSNVLLCPDGRPMLLDFNLSADPRAERERLGGTLPYMSPEQVLATFDPQRAADPVDGRSDLFSLGVILFELLTGRLPFGEVPRGVPSEEDCAALLARQRQGAPPLRRLCPQVTPALADVVARCLAFERARRPLDAVEVVAALRHDLAPHRRALRRLWHHPRKLAAAAALIAALAVGGTVYAVRQPSPAERGSREVEEAEAAGLEGKALEAADRAVVNQPEAETHILRARVAVRQRRWVAALNDYREANRLKPEARLSASIAYCLSREGEDASAAIENKKALDAGFVTAEVYNNLAYLQISNSKLPAGRTSLALAQGLKPRLPAACHNRLVLLRNELLRQDQRRLAEVQAALDLAIDACPESAELYGHAADLCAAAARCAALRQADQWVAGGEADRWAGLALNHLEFAANLGLDVGGRSTSPVYKDMPKRHRQRFDALALAPHPLAADVPTARLADPFLGNPAAP